MTHLICRLQGHRWARWVRVDFGEGDEARPFPEVRFCERCIRFQANVTAALIWRFGPFWRTAQSDTRLSPSSQSAPEIRQGESR